MSQSEARPKSNWESVARLENCTDARHSIWQSLHYFAKKNGQKNHSLDVQSWDIPKKTCSCNCSNRWFYKVLTQGGWIQMHTTLFRNVFVKKVWKTFIIFLPLHNYVPLCVGQSHKIPIKYIYAFGCSMTKCGTFQGVWILFQGTV